MTEITYKGANCVVIQTKNTTLITDPLIDGQKSPKALQKANVELITQSRFYIEAPEEAKLFSAPGEYEIGDLSIKGLAAQAQLDADGKNATVYRIVSSECTIAILGHINASLFKDAELESLGVIDILLVPVGGNGYTIDTHGAVALTRHIGPKIVIPVHFNEDGVAYEVAQDSVELFIKELGAPVQDQEQMLRIKQSAQLPDTLTVVKLERTA